MQIERIAHVAFQLAQKRNRRLCSVEKSNVLEVSMLWKEVVTAIGKQYPDVELSHMCVLLGPMSLLYVFMGRACSNVPKYLIVTTACAGMWIMQQCRSSGIRDPLTPL